MTIKLPIEFIKKEYNPKIALETSSKPREHQWIDDKNWHLVEDIESKIKKSQVEWSQYVQNKDQDEVPFYSLHHMPARKTESAKINFKNTEENALFKISINIGDTAYNDIQVYADSGFIEVRTKSSNDLIKKYKISTIVDPNSLVCRLYDGGILIIERIIKQDKIKPEISRQCFNLGETEKMPNKEKQFIIRPSYTKIRKSRNVIPNKENVYFRNKITLNTGENTNIKTLMQTNIDKLSKNKSHVEHVYVDTNIMNSIENHNEYIENIEIDEIFEPNDVNVEIHHGKQLILDIKKEKLFMDGSKSVYKYSKYITLPFSVDQKTVTVKFTPGFIKIRGIHKKRIDEMHDDNIMLNYD